MQYMYDPTHVLCFDNQWRRRTWRLIQVGCGEGSLGIWNVSAGSGREVHVPWTYVDLEDIVD